MVERRRELNQRYHRKKKLAKLKGRLAAAKDDKAKEAVLTKIRLLSPFWKETAKPDSKPAAPKKAPPAKKK